MLLSNVYTSRVGRGWGDVVAWYSECGKKPSILNTSKASHLQQNTNNYSLGFDSQNTCTHTRTAHIHVQWEEITLSAYQRSHYNGPVSYYTFMEHSTNGIRPLIGSLITSLLLSPSKIGGIVIVSVRPFCIRILTPEWDTVFRSHGSSLSLDL